MKELNLYKPFNMQIMDTDKFIIENNIQRVTSLMTTEPSTKELHPDGLFSERIFSIIGSPERLKRFGYIDLNTKIINPVIYENLIKLSNLYEDIMSSKVFAIWDDKIKNFKRSFSNDPEANTGYAFFLEHINDIVFDTTDSVIRKNRIELIKKYDRNILCQRIPVLPAGLRDIEITKTSIIQDGINKIYSILLSYSMAMPATMYSHNNIENISKRKTIPSDITWKINNPKDLLNAMKTIKYDNTSDKDKYKIKTPSQLFKDKFGLCYDQVELERLFFENLNIPYKTYFSSSVNIKDSPTHTFLVYKENDQYYWFENALVEYKGIHGPFESYSQTIEYVQNILIKSGWKSCTTIYYNPPINYNLLTINEFTEEIVNQGYTRSGEYVYDTLRYRIQLKIMELYYYLQNIIDDKNGFLQGGGYGSRSVAFGTRNVITSTSYAMEDPDDVRAIKPDETKVGIFQTAKGLQPIVEHFIRSIFFTPIFGDGNTTNIPLIDTSTYLIKYINTSFIEQEKYIGKDAIENWLNKFKNTDVRNAPITIQGSDKKNYYLFLVYDDDDRIIFFRSIKDLKSLIETSNIIKTIDINKIRPMIWAELVYVATYHASIDKHCLITRYPVIEEGSSYPSKIHLISTNPSRVVNLYDLISNTDIITYHQYPVIGATYIDSTIIHASSLSGLDGDFDGDMVSVNYLMGSDSNEEIKRYMNRVQSFITPEKKFLRGGTDKLMNLTLMNMSQ